MTSLLLAIAVVAADPKPVVVPLGPMNATAPADWVSEKPSNLLRSHQFKLASSDPAFAAAEVAVYKEGSAKVSEKFSEWKATFDVPEGKTADDLAKVSKITVNGATVHILDMSGTWKYRERPRDPKSKEELRPEYRVLWVILIKDEEAAHVRFSGPIPVVEKHFASFDKWLKSAK